MADKDQKSEEGKPYTVDDQLAHVEALNRTYALGNRAFERGDYKEAAELLQKAAKDYMREAYRRENQEGAVQWLLTELTIYRDWIGKNLKYIPHPLEGQTGEVSKSHGVDRDVVAFVKSPEWENHVAYLGSVFTEKERGRHGPSDGVYRWVVSDMQKALTGDRTKREGWLADPEVCVAMDPMVMAYWTNKTERERSDDS